MEDLFVALAVFFVGFIFGWNLREYMAKRYVDQFVRENLETLEKFEEEHTINIVIERHGEMLYVFEKDGSFMAQGKNRRELESALAKGFPNKRFYASAENLKEVGLK